ncbi:MAG TPA: DPP IV N-terminal domain-containing protein, partial [Phycisphaerales bacterium]|nr:DPP IV N-terminal domain-containing protein [Phycisphaerales bacterium]
MATLCALGTLAALSATQGAPAQVKPHAGMLRYPDVSATSIVFVYANDLWIAPREGGMATPLASPPGGESFPKFSSDGKTIAFVGNYDGGNEIYTIATDGSDGGLPKRVTHHPSGERLCEWTRGGRLLFSARDLQGLGQMGKLFTVGSGGGLPEMIDVPYGTNATISDDGTWLVYTPHSIDNRTWKRYRGGMQTDIWMFNLKDKTSRRITDWEGTDTLPMWRGSGNGGKVYYLSDSGPEHRLNIWEFDVAKNARKQVTEFKDFDVKWPSIGPGKSNNGEIVFQCGAGLYLLDLSNGKSKQIEITIPGDRPTLRERTIDATRFAGSWSISSTGKRAVLEARGDIWTAPAENGSPRQLTATSGIAERMPAWSPDGQWISYVSDATGEYELYIMQSDGKGETKQLTKDGSCYRFNGGWSPDSKRLLFADKTGSLFMYTLEGGETKLIDKDPWSQSPGYSWSHDSRWLAYDRTINRGRKAIWIYNLESGEKTQVTSGFFNDVAPTFDRKGDWLFYASNRNFQPQYGDIPGDTSFVYERSAVLLAVPLRADVENPWLPKSDEEKWGEEKKKAETQPAESQPDAKESDEAKPGNGNGGAN